MMKHALIVRCAPIAIAASAALVPLAAVAQDAPAQPVIVLPDVAPAAAPSAPAAAVPEIVLPAEVAVDAPAAPEAETAPVVAAPVQRAAPRETASTVTAQRSVERPAASAATMAASTSPTTPQAVSQPAVPVRASAEPMAMAEEPAATVPADNGATGEIPLAALLGAMGLAAVGGVAFAASRRNRRRTMEPALYQETADDRIADAPEPVLAPSPALAMATPAPAPAFRRDTTPASGDPVALPAEIPATFEERDALLKALIAAEPDRANPFTSPRARARRAKLIMQSLGRSFRTRKPRIDLSEYTSRWPSLRGWQPATA